MSHYNVIIVGAGAAGLMCAATSALRHSKVLVIEHTAHIGEKIRISGGGRCNFTNLNASAKNYISANPHFATSALSRYTAADFIALVSKHGITYHEKTLGQLFCDGSSKQIIAMLMKECQERNVTISTHTSVSHIAKESCFTLTTSNGPLTCDSLVIATGGLSIPKLGATGFGYEVARQFGLKIITPKPALVPLVMQGALFPQLSGVALDSIASCNGVSFRENTLFTHRGLSGPAILQISSYLDAGDSLTLNLAPGTPLLEQLKAATHGKTMLSTLLNRLLPKRLAGLWCETMCPAFASRPLAEIKHTDLEKIAHQLQHWQLQPAGTEGYLKAEVTAGGVDTDELSSKTMGAHKVPGLFFIGEVVDVTGWLGGYNFQWAWSSAVAAGSYT